MSSDAVVVLTTLPADADAAAFARVLLDERLVACVNLLPVMESLYWWEGAVAEDRERQLVMKTSTDRVPALRERIHDLHPYDVPEVLVLPVLDGSDAYLRWIGDATRPAPRDRDDI